MRKRWTLTTTPLDRGNDWHVSLSLHWNRDPRRYWLKHNAKQAAWFYEKRLGLPLHFYVRRLE